MDSYGHNFFHEFESSETEQPVSFFVKIEFPCDNANHLEDIRIFPDESCQHEITQLVKDIDMDLFKEIQNQAFKEAAQIVEDAA